MGLLLQSLAWMLMGTALAPAAPLPDQEQVVTRTVRIQQRVIVRLPRAPVSSAAIGGAPMVPPLTWVERPADKCVPMSRLAAASISQGGSVDLLLAGGKRVRARLGSDCPALDFYSGMYLKGTPDGQVCAARDSIRSRSGGQCRIESFHTLIPAR